jgi:hypothetical protein
MSCQEGEAVRNAKLLIGATDTVWFVVSVWGSVQLSSEGNPLAINQFSD